MSQRLFFFMAASVGVLASVSSAAAQQPPAPGRIVNAASFVPFIAPGAIATLIGANLADSTASAPVRPLPNDLAGTSVLIGRQPAQLYYVSPTQINLVVPQDVSSAEVIVIRSGIASPVLMAELEAYHEGFFTLDGSGQGPAGAFHADSTAVSKEAPALRGETIHLFGTGKGRRNPAVRAPEPAPIVRVGDVVAIVASLEQILTSPGLDLVNLTIPMDAPTGPAVPVTMQLFENISRPVTLAIQ